MVTLKIRHLMRSLAQYMLSLYPYMQPAARVSYLAALMLAGDGCIGKLVEYGKTSQLFTHPTARPAGDYITRLEEVSYGNESGLS
jgi:ABC-type phosphate transport system ATPase subunit